jgi:multidrug efflux pump subunit AcrA (membrane-fusion protein)
VKYVLGLLAFLVVAACIGVGAYQIGYQRGVLVKKPGETPEEGKTGQVKTVPARKAMMGKVVSAYGVVRAAPEAMHTFSAAYESRVRRFLVTPGQPVAPGTALLEIEPSPATLLQVAQARSTVDSATKKVAQARQAAAAATQDARNVKESTAKALKQVQQRLDMKLATSADLVTAQQDATAAELKLKSLLEMDTSAEVLQAQQDLALALLQQQSLEKLAIQAPQVKSEVAGVVDSLAAQEGQIVPAGGPLVLVAEEKRIEVKLNVEPSDAAALKAGMTVSVAPVLSMEDKKAKPAEGKIRLVSARVNPTSRLVEVYVALPADAGLLLESNVFGRVVLDPHEALVVPRAAVLPFEDKHILYVVEKDKDTVSKRTVETGIEDGDLVEITKGMLEEDDDVVVAGNYELEDAMEVEVKNGGEAKDAAPAPKK